MNDRIAIDLSAAQKSAERVRSLLLKLWATHDLQRYEYTRTVRIAPSGPCYSHPVLTLNGNFQAEEQVLCTYLHEQMHWYLTWYSHGNTSGWQEIWDALRQAYPSLPIGFPEGANDEFSSCLHIIVNYLEIEAVSNVLGQDVARGLAAKNFIYRGLYEIVLRDWEPLTALYRRHGLSPIRSAGEMSEHDLQLAARMDEAPLA
ncbi:hypothetical protein FF100_27925 [Methylobacterium terricola]|uniref:Uncharacterized protein n=1 Tax=Methylobacterium terricola TaxID=2583531 RepID=A0A5C4L9T9_9HYPH|nr:hypothetical protein [Methylobacterium terricola]TNC08887.1 hypothetical protein FF100_27925 [Methylobacterium terricola]